MEIVYRSTLVSQTGKDWGRFERFELIALLFSNVLQKLIEFEGVHDVLPGEPSPTGLEDSELHEVKFTSSMGIRVYGNPESHSLCGSQVTNIQIEPLRMAVQLHDDVVFSGGLKHLLKVNLEFRSFEK